MWRLFLCCLSIKQNQEDPLRDLTGEDGLAFARPTNVLISCGCCRIKARKHVYSYHDTQRKQLLSLNHPNIITFLNVPSVTSIYSYPWQQTLGEFIVNTFNTNNQNRFQATSQKTAPRRFYFQITKALAYLHTRNILFNNLNVDNIVLTRKGCRLVCKLANFSKYLVYEEVVDFSEDIKALALVFLSMAYGQHVAEINQQNLGHLNANELVNDNAFSSLLTRMTGQSRQQTIAITIDEVANALPNCIFKTCC